MNPSLRIFFLSALILALSGCQLFAPQPVWIDVRSVEEYQEENLAGTYNIPHTEIEARISSLGISKSTPVKLFCRSGRRAGVAMTTLQELGYTNVENVGGIADARVLLESSN